MAPMLPVPLSYEPLFPSLEVAPKRGVSYQDEGVRSPLGGAREPLRCGCNRSRGKERSLYQLWLNSVCYCAASLNSAQRTIARYVMGLASYSPQYECGFASVLPKQWKGSATP